MSIISEHRRRIYPTFVLLSLAFRNEPKPDGPCNFLLFAHTGPVRESVIEGPIYLVKVVRASRKIFCPVSPSCKTMNGDGCAGKVGLAKPGLCPFLRCIGASPSLAAADVIPFTYRSRPLSGFALSRQPSPFPIRERSALSSFPHVSLTSPSLSLSPSLCRPPVLPRRH